MAVLGIAAPSPSRTPQAEPVSGGRTTLLVDGPRVQANLPTPWVGVWERLNIVVWMLWITVLAIALLRRQVVRRLP